MAGQAQSVGTGERRPGVPLLAAVILLFLYAWPRLVVGAFGVDSPWTSHLYKYGFGAVFFFIGVYLVLRTGACDLRRYHDRGGFRLTLFGFFWFTVLHALWILAALAVPFKGGQ